MPAPGGIGQPLSFTLPDGIRTRVYTKRDTYPDVTEWNGIHPTLLVHPTVAALQVRQDPAWPHTITTL